ncbi:DUF2339 domain-containing protein [Primorskyibacter sp. 2E107]|uniref:DUF2339 domain-containing protein n=1 Tax=Primorskyibacter sp. 2E107 TaxID=3403458 RepID=UPI003AF4986B
MTDDAIIALIILFLLAVPITLVYLLIVVIRLKRRVAALEAGQTAPIPEAMKSAATGPARPVPAPPARIDAAPAEAGTAAEGRAPWRSPPKPPAAPKRPSVLAAQLSRLTHWLRENWFYAAAAASLALAGLFLVQYGVENGLLPPAARVAAALSFGVLLIAGGEVIRRRFGDSEASATAYLPSVLSGAGLVSIFGGLVAARMLYGLIAPTPALVLLFAAALGGLLLGWRHGPLLAAIGLIGGMLAPFLVGGSSDTPQTLFAYFALLAALGLGFDTLRRWAWISVLSVVFATAAGWLLLSVSLNTDAFGISFAAFVAILAILATLIPARGLTPDHDGPCLVEAVLKRQGKPIFPALLSLGTLLAAIPAILLIAGHSPMTAWAAILVLTALGAAYALWSLRAPALQDHALLPTLGLLAICAVNDLNAPIFDALRQHLADTASQTETRFSLDITWMLLAATVLSVVFAWRSQTGAENRLPWAGAAALTAPLAGLLLEATRHPAGIIGAYPWALHGLALAALMTLMAERLARQTPEDKSRTALPVLSALACLAFALAITLTSTALTLAIAATIVAAAALDRRFDLPLMGAYIAAGVVAIGLRLTFDPGVGWATQTTLLPMLLAYGGSLTALLAAYALMQGRPRPKSRVFLESAAWSVAGMTLSLTLFHIIRTFAPEAGLQTHWGYGLLAALWSGVAMAQLFRQELGGWLRPLRIALAALFGVIAGVFLLLLLTDFNPLIGRETVLGPVLLNTLIPAYLLPAAFLAIAACRLTRQPKALRRSLVCAALALAAFWVMLTIRHGWQGGSGMRLNAGVTQPELYSYTVALLLAGAALFYQALARRSDLLRRAGVAIIALAVAKVFVIDISGLSGLVRVFSFLLLGLSLAGLAWLNRWVQGRAAPNRPPD